MKLAAPLFALIFAGCAADTDLETAFCEALQAGAVRTVDAATDLQSPPDVTDVGAVDIRLSEVEGGYGGYVRYEADEAGSFAFGLSQDVPMTVLDASGAEVPVDQTIEGASCDELAIRHTFTLEQADYIIMFGPTDQTVVALVAEESDDDL